MNRIQKNPTQQGPKTPIADAIDLAMILFLAAAFAASLVWIVVGD